MSDNLLSSVIAASTGLVLAIATPHATQKSPAEEARALMGQQGKEVKVASNGFEGLSPEIVNDIQQQMKALRASPAASIIHATGYSYLQENI